MEEEKLYQHMYGLLFRGIVNGLDLLELGQPDAAAERLKEALIQAEDRYLDWEQDT